MSEQNEATNPATSTKETEVAQKAQLKAQREDAKRKENLAKYPHCDVNTIRWEPTANKYSVEIISVVSQQRRRVYTSDVFQIDCTEAEMKDRKAAKKKAQKVLLEKAKALVASGEVK